MNGNGLISLAIIAVTVFFSYKGINDRPFFKKYSFGVDKVLLYKNYKVMLTSGLVHVNWLHLIFNMVSLFIFSQGLETYLGEWKFLLIYVLSLFGGNLFSLFMHRRHGDYTAAGASGAVCGLIFASIALFPGMNIMFIPAWLFGIIYVIYSIYGIRSNASNIGHEAHLAGALIGMLSAIAMSPEVLRVNYVPILLVLVPMIVFIYIIMIKPGMLQVDNRFFKTHEPHTIDDRYNLARNHKQQELDRILEKIHNKGMGSLTRKEKDFLNSQ